MSTQQKPLWGGFGTSMHPALEALSVSMEADLPLTDADLRCSAAYARALGRAGVITQAQGEELARCLLTLRDEFQHGQWAPRDAEDVHSAIEAEVTRRLPELGGRLHTGRSRNDQVATAFRVATRERIDTLRSLTLDLAQALVERARSEVDTLLPAYTHLQRAQPIRLAHWLLAYTWPLLRDAERLREARRRVNVMPLGSGAVSGHPFDLDREALRQELGFEAMSENSLDAVGDRDFAVETVFGCTLAAIHLSRLADELVIWSMSEVGFIEWPDDLATGSSLMPNKKNPDLAELVRGKTGGVVGDLVSLVVLLKGLPQSYQRDLQEDKPPVWRATRALELSLKAMAAAIAAVRFNAERMSQALTDDILATEAADVLVARGVPFREAHHAVAQAAALARQERTTLKAIAQNAALPAPLHKDDLLRLSPLAAIERRTARGGTAKATVLEQLERAQATLNELR